MKKIVFRAFCFAMVFAFAVGFAACEKEEARPTESYVYHPAEETTSEPEPTSAEKTDRIRVDTSWRDNFAVTYTYFNSEQGSTVNVCEKRSDQYFSAEDTDSGDTLYYKNGTAGVDSYVLVPGEAEQVHSVIAGKTLGDLSSTFMKLSEVDENLPALSNVLYMYDEAVAERTCAKYIQRAYSGGELTKTVYVWIDAEFGFAAKGEVYDADEKLTASWEVKSFAAGNVKDSDVEIDLSEYKIVED